MGVVFYYLSVIYQYKQVPTITLFFQIFSYAKVPTILTKSKLKIMISFLIFSK